MSSTDSSADKRITATSERREQIIQRLRQQGSVQVNDLSVLFGVSTVTIRNDLAFLEKQGIAVRAYGGSNDPVPIGAALTGLILVNTFYWCTNQGIVQRTLASKSLSEGQKGALLTAVLKMLDPLILVLPGVIAFHLFQDLPKADMAYPALVNKVMPLPLIGFFSAVLFGAIISAFCGFLNSASTLFSLGIYRRLINEQASPDKLVTVGRRFGFIVAVISVLVAPWIAYAPQGLDRKSVV